MVASAGHEIEKYDQLCDLIESHLVLCFFINLRSASECFQSRAIAVLKRDLKREEQRKKDAALAAAAKTRAADSLRPTETVANLEAPSSQDAPIASTSPVTASAGPGRRPSAISISSLQRPTAPLKLDLSATALRMSEDPALFSGGLASPVTLAPKSARPLGSNEFPPEFMAALASAADSNRAVDIDLTAEENDTRLPLTLDPAVGSSADKPIELDLDSMDLDMVGLFGDTGGDESPDAKTIDGLFSLHKAPGGDIARNDYEKSQKEEGHFLAPFTGDGGNGMFSHQNKAPGPDSHHHDVLSAFSPPDQPGAMGPPNTTTNTVHGEPSSFDFASLDLTNLSSSFFSSAGETDMTFSMDEFLNMGGNTGEAKGNAMDVS